MYIYIKTQILGGEKFMSLIIKSSAISTGSILITKEDLIDHFKKQGKDLSNLITNVIGTKQLYHADGVSENTITLAAKAVDKVLSNSHTDGKDIDLIVFTSQFPEYTIPSQACIIHNHIHGKNKCLIFDLNVNCLGMLRGLDIINRYFDDRKGDLKKALLIGSDYMSIHVPDDEPITYANVGDGACAMLLEYTKEKNVGIIDSSDRTNSSEVYNCFFPECGISNLKSTRREFFKTCWANPDTELSVNSIKDALFDVLKKNNLKVEDIDWYCGSQFTLSYFNEVREACNIPESKGIYIADKYGYTGTSSPFFAFTEGVNDGRIKKGDLVFFTTVGVGFSICSMLVRV